MLKSYPLAMQGMEFRGHGVTVRAGTYTPWQTTEPRCTPSARIYEI